MLVCLALSVRTLLECAEGRQSEREASGNRSVNEVQGVDETPQMSKRSHTFKLIARKRLRRQFNHNQSPHYSRNILIRYDCPHNTSAFYTHVGHLPVSSREDAHVFADCLEYFFVEIAV